MSLCSASVERDCTLGFVEPHANTMFKRFQLHQFLVDLDEAAGRAELTEPQHDDMQTIRNAAEEAIRANGYLYILGD